MHPKLAFALFPVIPFVAAGIGWLLARWVGRPDEFWRTGLPVFVTLASALGILSGWPPQMGYDLVGGVRLVYEAEPWDDEEQNAESLHELVAALQRRVDPSGTEGSIVRLHSPTQVEILMPRASAIEIEEIKKRVTTSGHLQLRILADLQRDDFVCSRSDHESQANTRTVVGRAGEPIAEWVTIGTNESGDCFLDPGELVGHKTRKDQNSGETEILVLIDPFNVEGQHLARAWAGYDSQMRSCIHFTLSRGGAARFGALTGANLPDKQTDFYRKLGIIMDGKLMSAPRIMSRITDRGQITGKFTTQEVEFLAAILKAGRLPARVNPEPIIDEFVRRGDRAQWAVGCVAATLAALLLISAIAVICFGFHGFAAGVAAWLGAVMLAAGLLLGGFTVTFPTVVAACAVVLALAIGLVVLGRLTRAHDTAGRDGSLAASNAFPWPLRAVVVLVPLMLVAAVAYVVGMGQMRQIATVLAIGALSGTASVLLCFWPLQGLFVPPAELADTETGVVTAALSEQDAPNT